MDDDVREVLEARLAQLEAVIERAPVGIGVVDLEGHTPLTNAHLRRMLGYTAEEFAGMPFAAYSHAEDNARNLLLWERMVAGEIDDFAMEKRFVRKDGSLVWAELTVSLVRDGLPAPYAIGMSQDITTRKRLESELRAAELRSRLLVERVPAVVYISEPGASGAWHYVSPQLERMLGYTPEEWMADASLWFARIHPDDREFVLDRTVEIMSGEHGQLNSSTYRLTHRDGRTVWVRDDSVVLRDPSGRVAFHGVIVDVTAEKALEAQLEYQAAHDSLTGLVNRTRFRREVEDAIATLPTDLRRPAVLFVDLDEFKDVNDRFGHTVGDHLLVAVGAALQGTVGERGTAARFGGDEFALLVHDVPEDRLPEFSEQVLAAVRSATVVHEGVEVHVDGSVGAAVIGPGDTVEQLLRRADTAMYAAKRADDTGA
ncbi:PAS domain S-box protein [Cellulomonas soli]